MARPFAFGGSTAERTDDDPNMGEANGDRGDGWPLDAERNSERLRSDGDGVSGGGGGTPAFSGSFTELGLRTPSTRSRRAVSTSACEHGSSG